MSSIEQENLMQRMSAPPGLEVSSGRDVCKCASAVLAAFQITEGNDSLTQLCIAAAEQ